MSCSNNITPCTSCGQTTDACGCKTSSDEVVYQGPALGCTGIENCDTLTTVFQTMDGFICGPEMVQTIINNITNNQSLFLQFMTIVNNSVDCQTVWDCIDANTTTTTSTTICPCTYYQVTAPLDISGTLTYVECETGDINTVTGDPIPNYYCVDNNYPVIRIGKISAFNTNICCEIPPVTTTTTTTVPATTTTTTTVLDCTCVKFTISQTDLNAAAGNTYFPNNVVSLSSPKGAKCSGGNLPGQFTVAGEYIYCVRTVDVPSLVLYYNRNDGVVFSTVSTITNLATLCAVDGECGI